MDARILQLANYAQAQLKVILERRSEHRSRLDLVRKTHSTLVKAFGAGQIKLAVSTSNRDLVNAAIANMESITSDEHKHHFTKPGYTLGQRDAIKLCTDRLSEYRWEFKHAPIQSGGTARTVSPRHDGTPG